LRTNGVITPEEAIRQSARVLVDQLNVFAALEGTETAAEVPSRAPTVDPICCVQLMTSNSRFVRLTACKAQNIVLHWRFDSAQRKRIVEDAKSGS